MNKYSTLNESNNYLKFIGMSYILLTFAYFWEWINLSNLALIAYSFAGLLFVFIDVLEYWISILKNKRSIKLVKVIHFLKQIIICSAVVCLVLVPFLNFKFLNTISDKLTTCFSFIALGLTILFLGYKYDTKLKEFASVIEVESNNLKNRANELIEKSKELTEKSKELDKRSESLIEKSNRLDKQSEKLVEKSKELDKQREKLIEKNKELDYL